MKRQFFLFVVAATCLSLACGCSGKPSGFPSVKPCKIVVTNGSEPIADVDVALIPAQPISGTIIGGKTDAQGVCVVQTTFANFAAKGSPQGEFTVTLRKDPTPETPALTVEQMGEMSRGDIDKYNKERDAEIASMPKIIPPPLTSMQTSPVKVNVPSDAEKTIDVSQF